MRKASLATAKAHLSELVDAAEHKKARILILRHGKPAAALVPVDVAFADEGRRKRMTTKQAYALLDELAELGSPDAKLVDDLLRSRR